MLTLRKLKSLADGTRRRKTVMLIRDFEQTAALGEDTDRSYLRGLLNIISTDNFWSNQIRSLSAEELPEQPDALRHALNRLRHRMIEALGRSWADWDAENPADPRVCKTAPLRIFLDGLRSPFNVGSLMRTALAFGAERIWLSPETVLPTHPRCRRSSMGAAGKISWDICVLDDLLPEQTGTVFALEQGGCNIGEFHFPESGTVIAGSEELGISPRALKRAESDGGIVSIPLTGGKSSLNVGVALGILLERWTASLSPDLFQ